MVQLTINGADAFQRYGIIMPDGGMAALRKPAPNKAFIQNKSRLQHGKRVIRKNPKKDERQIILPIIITAKDESDFNEKYDLFVSEVLDTGYLVIKTSKQPNVYYRCIYEDCQQYTEFAGEMAKFMLSLTEPNPDNRAEESSE
ncbi:MAG: hypothetical protein IJ640_09300 [Prevotella sp.]|nr:hypothetical protein [Prevotella sp.]